MADRDENGRFIKGHSGGPGRPPKEQAVTDLLRETADKQELVNTLLKLALGGDKQALIYCIDRLDGKPRETVHQVIENLPEVVEVDLSDEAYPGDVAVVEIDPEIQDS